MSEHESPNSNDKWNVSPPSIAEGMLAVDPGLGFSTKMCRNEFERRLISVVSHEFLLPGVVLTVYSLSIISCFLSGDMYAFWLNFGAVVLLLTLNMKYLVWASNFKNKNTFLTTIQSEKFRVVVSLMCYTVRFLYCLDQSRILLLPTSFMLVFSANKLGTITWKLLPTCYVSLHFLLFGLWKASMEWYMFGFTEVCVNTLAFFLSGGFIVLVFSFYMIAISGFLSTKVQILEDTKQELVTALQVSIDMASRNLTRFIRL